jgi:hypothetical protein
VLVLVPFSNLFASHGKNNVAINTFVVFKSILQYIVHDKLIEFPVCNNFTLRLQILYEVNIDSPLEDVVFEWPNNIPNGGDHVLVRSWLDLELILLDLHPFDLISVLEPNGLGRLLNTDYILKVLFGILLVLNDSSQFTNFNPLDHLVICAV